MEKKITIRLWLDNEKHREVYDRLQKRDTIEYRSITDYVCAAVLSFEDKDAGRCEQMTLSQNDMKALAEEIAAAIAERQYISEPAI